MSNSVYAHLIYGFEILDDEGNRAEDGNLPLWLEDNETDIAVVCARIDNILPPQIEFDNSNSEIVAQYRQYWNLRDTAAKKYGIELVAHCRGSYSMYILGISESYNSEHRGDVSHLGQAIIANPEWRDKLKNFCDKAGIPFTEPEWLLAPYSEY